MSTKVDMLAKDFFALVYFEIDCDVIGALNAFVSAAFLQDRFDQETITVDVVPDYPIKELHFEEDTPSLENVLSLVICPTLGEEDNIPILLIVVTIFRFDHDTSFLTFSHVLHGFPKAVGQSIITESELDWFPIICMVMVNEDFSLALHVIRCDSNVLLFYVFGLDCAIVYFVFRIGFAHLISRAFRICVLVYLLFTRSKVAKQINLNNIGPTRLAQLLRSNLKDGFNNLLLLDNGQLVPDLISGRFAVAVIVIVRLLCLFRSH